MIDLKDIFGKTWGEVIEQIGHALMSGIPAFAASNFLPIGDPLQVAVAVLVGMLGIPARMPWNVNWGLSREYWQNVGDPPDEETWFSIWRVPVNSNMFRDVLAYGIGTAVSSVLVAIF